MPSSLPPTWAKQKTVAVWRKRVLDTLGGPEWNVELTESMLDNALNRALMVFAKYHPVWDWRPLGLISGELVLDWSEEVDDGTAVKDVKWMKNQEMYYSPGTRNSLLNRSIYGMRAPRRVFKQLVAQDRYDFFLGAGPIWSWDPPTKTLFINTKSYEGVYGTALILKPHVLDNIRYDHEVDFLDGAVGYAKQTLARVLGKFGAIPAAQGTITTDANTLRSEAKSEIEAFKDILDRNMKHFPPQPIWG